MHVFISLVDDQLYLEEITPHRHDCHDRPHAAGVGFRDDKSPPRGLAGVARSAPGEQHLLRWGSRRTQLGGEDCIGMWGQTAGATTVARFICRGTCGRKMAIPRWSFLPSRVCGRRRSPLTVGEHGLWQRHGQISNSLRGCFLVQVASASFRTTPITNSWSFWFNFLKVAMSLDSRVSGAALLPAAIASGSLLPPRNSWYVSISSAFAILSRVSMLGTVCPFSTLEV
jgi:hypothetical protein